jgi:hypothetical protein
MPNRAIPELSYNEFYQRPPRSKSIVARNSSAIARYHEIHALLQNLERFLVGREIISSPSKKYRKPMFVVGHASYYYFCLTCIKAEFSPDDGESLMKKSNDISFVNRPAKESFESSLRITILNEIFL